MGLLWLLVLGKYALDVGPDGRFGGDFLSFWTAARHVAQGHPEAVYDVEHWRAVVAAGGQVVLAWFVYPPHTLLLLWPLGHLDYAKAVWVWSLAPLVPYFLLLAWLTRRSLDTCGWRTQHGLVVALAMTAALPLLVTNTMSGQSGTLLAVFLLAASGWANRPLLTGLALALLSIKPQVAILLPLALIAVGHWRTLAVATAGTAALAALVTVWLGPQIWSRYLDMTRLFASVVGTGYGGVQQLAVAPYVSMSSVGAPPLVAGVVQLLCSAAVLAVVVRAFRRTDAAPNLDLKFGLIAAGTLLFTPYALSYDMPLLIAGFAPVLVRFWRDGIEPWELLVLVCLLALPMLQPMAVRHGFPAGFLITALWFVLVARRHAATAA